MSTQFRLKKSRGLIAAALMAALILVPTALSGDYTDPSGDSGTAGDITSVTVAGDKASGQLLFRITGTNIASSETSPLFLDIDSDANPLTGDITDNGSDYSFYVDNTSYFFAHWDGSNWVATPDLSVQVSGGTSQILISVNRSEIGNTSMFNFLSFTVNSTDRVFDLAPNQGAFNYSFDANGPQIISVDVKKTPAAGPKAGKRFVIVPTGLKLPPDGQLTPPAILPTSYSCTAKLGAKKLATGTGVCSIAIPKKKAKGKRLTVLLTVNYQGATKVVPLTFKVK
ncbi:MAG TPA: hypothetical protein VIL73_08910 [Gaiellaceae bacterium]|jgi:hypothetical protein